MATPVNRTDTSQTQRRILPLDRQSAEHTLEYGQISRMKGAG